MKNIRLHKLKKLEAKIEKEKAELERLQLKYPEMAKRMPKDTKEEE